MNETSYLHTKEAKEIYTKWAGFIENKVDFSYKASSIHTKDHEKRVLLFALIIGEEKHISTRDMEILAAAAAFHDTRRQSDGPDVGHGLRGARHYKEFAKNKTIPFYPLSYTIMAYHDRDDKEGYDEFQKENSLKGALLYSIFKDADGLDRYRISQTAFDPRFLRTDEAKELVPLAKKLNGKA